MTFSALRNSEEHAVTATRCLSEDTLLALGLDQLSIDER